MQTSLAMKMAQEVDPDRKRTIGVLTKVHLPARVGEREREREGEGEGGAEREG